MVVGVFLVGVVGVVVVVVVVVVVAVVVLVAVLGVVAVAVAVVLLGSLFKLLKEALRSRARSPNLTLDLLSSARDMIRVGSRSTQAGSVMQRPQLLLTSFEFEGHTKWHALSSNPRRLKLNPGLQSLTSWNSHGLQAGKLAVAGRLVVDRDLVRGKAMEGRASGP